MMRLEQLGRDGTAVGQGGNVLNTGIRMTMDGRGEGNGERIDFQSLDIEVNQLHDAILVHMKVWSNLEVALSALLYETLNITPRTSHLSYVIYYSPDGFDARQKLVDKVMRQFIQENPNIKALEPY